MPLALCFVCGEGRRAAQHVPELEAHKYARDLSAHARAQIASAQKKRVCPRRAHKIPLEHLFWGARETHAFACFLLCCPPRSSMDDGARPARRSGLQLCRLD